MVGNYVHHFFHKNMKTIVLASNNQSKIKELTPLMANIGFTLANQSLYFAGEAPEPHKSFIENAISKARFASKATGLPALADDSGLVVPALGGELNPGVDSAFYGTKFGYPRTDEANNRALLENMKGIEDRSAFLVTVLVAIRSHDDPLPLVSFGKLEGVIMQEESPVKGFGYDSVLYVPLIGKALSEVPLSHKQMFSHRSIACGKMVELIKDNW